MQSYGLQLLAVCHKPDKFVTIGIVISEGLMF